MGRFGRSWALAKASWTVLRADKELLILPIISFVATAVAAVSFFVPVFLLGSTTSTSSELGGSTSTFEMGPAGMAVAFVGYIVLAYITIFFNAALISAANQRMDGGDPTLGSALRGAGARAIAILPWAVVSATVSIVLRAISERSGLIGKIVVGIIGMAWSLVTFLVLPILVIEGIGVGAAIKRSTDLFKRTWGEQVIANAGIGLVSMLAILAGLPVLALVATGVTALAVVGVVVFVLWVVLVAVVTSALSVVYQTALYRYSVGRPAAGFGTVDLGGAFHRR